MTGGAVGARYSPASHGGGTSRISRHYPFVKYQRSIPERARLKTSNQPWGCTVFGSHPGPHHCPATARRLEGIYP